MHGENLGPSAQTTSDIQQIAKAETNQNSPLFQSMLQQNKQAGQSQLAGTIAQLEAQNRLAQTSGQKPLLDQERGGESVFRNLMQGQEQVGNAAVGQTYNQLGQAQQSLTGSLNAQNGLANAQYGNTQKQTAGYGTIGQALQGMFGLGNSLNKTPTPTGVTAPQQTQPYNYNNSNYTTPVQQNTLLPTNYGYQATGGY